MANKYYLNEERQASPIILVGETYTFNLADDRNVGHPILFSTTPNGTHSGGVVYNESDIAYVIDDIQVSYERYIEFMNNEFDADKRPKVLLTPSLNTPPKLYYFCSNHSQMGGELTIQIEAQFRSDAGGGLGSNPAPDREVTEGTDTSGFDIYKPPTRDPEIYPEIGPGKPIIIDVAPGPRLNICCTGNNFTCLMKCIREEESRGEENEGCNAQATDCGDCDYDGDGDRDGQSVPIPGRFDSNCDGVRDCLPGDPCDTFGTFNSCDCGPYQISWRNYLEDICGTSGGNIRPCRGGDSEGGDGPGGTNPGYDTANCCEVCEDGYAATLCKECVKGDSACCAEKKRKSEKLIDCWRRRYTRNFKSKSCQCTGKTIHEYTKSNGKKERLPCCTCEDLARMHNGGPCGHRKDSTDGYWRNVSACMKREKCNPNQQGITKPKPTTAPPKPPTRGDTPQQDSDPNLQSTPVYQEMEDPFEDLTDPLNPPSPPMGGGGY